VFNLVIAYRDKESPVSLCRFSLRRFTDHYQNHHGFLFSSSDSSSDSSFDSSSLGQDSESD
jgi:hypothetical protein